MKQDHKRNIAYYIMAILLGFMSKCVPAKNIIVDNSGNGDYNSVQEGLNHAEAGDTISVKDTGTPYFEKINFPISGDSAKGYITLSAFPGQQPIIDGTGVPNNPANYTDDLIYMSDKNYIRVNGFILRNIQASEGSGIRVYGYGSHIELTNNEIYNILGGAQDGGAMGITIYGSNDFKSINNILIDGNFIHDCDPAWSEALTLNGNVENFQVTHNTVQDVNNIGIDFIGGETWLSNKVARNGVCAWNKVIRANSSYEDGYAAGIYVDGGKNILVEKNIVSGSDIGMEIGSENQGIVASSIIVRDNIIYNNNKGGLAFGGYASNTGRVRYCQFYNNTFYKNDILKQSHGELWIQYADSNEVENNIFYCNDQNIVLSSWDGNQKNTLDYNLWYSESNPTFIWNGKSLYGLTEYQSYTSQDTNSISSDPIFANPNSLDFQLTQNSPAINRGDPNYKISPNETDMNNGPRINGNIIDIGAYEFAGVTSINKTRTLPSSIAILPPYPDPFNGLTNFILKIPAGSASEKLSLTLYDNLGRKVKTIFSGRLNEGRHDFKWDGTDENNNTVSSGVYYLILKGGNRLTSNKVILLK